MDSPCITIALLVGKVHMVKLDMVGVPIKPHLVGDIYPRWLFLAGYLLVNGTGLEWQSPTGWILGSNT